MFLVVHMLKIMPTLTAVYLSGEWGRRLTSFVIAVYCFGTCITFLVIIGELIGERSPKSVRRRLLLRWVSSDRSLTALSSSLIGQYHGPIRVLENLMTFGWGRENPSVRSHS